MRSLIVSLSALLFACTAQRIVPPDPPLQRQGLDLHDLRLDVHDFSISSASSEDTWGAKEYLEQVFLEFLRSEGSYEKVRGPYEIARDAGKQQTSPIDPVPVRLDVQVSLDETLSLTGVMDALFFYPGCGVLWPLAPRWGEAVVDLQVRVRFPDTKGIPEPLRLKVSAPYSIVFYSYYRTAPIEDAFQRAYELAFREMSQRLAQHLKKERRKGLAQALADREAAIARLTAVETASTATVAFAQATIHTATIAKIVLTAPEMPRADSFAGFTTQFQPPEQIFLPPDDFGVISVPRRPARHDLMGRYLGSLGGVEIARFEGGASVESRASTRTSPEELVGSGEATAEGYRIALYRPPDRTGFFFPPTIGLLSQTITISGFREDVPIFGVRGEGRDIGAVASDPATGRPVDIDEPIEYGLRLKSAFIGQGLGLNLVFGDENVQIFSTVAATVNIIELRHTNVRIWQNEVEGFHVAFFKSYQLSAQLGFAIPDWHVAFRGSLERDAYLDFDYPQAVDFRATQAYNAEKDIWERQRAFVNGASLETYHWQLSAVFLF